MMSSRPQKKWKVFSNGFQVGGEGALAGEEVVGALCEDAAAEAVLGLLDQAGLLRAGQRPQVPHPSPFPNL